MADQRVFESNPGAVLGTTWGQASQAASQTQQANQGNQWNQVNQWNQQALSSGSNSANDDESEYTSDEEDEEDDDYAPLQMSTWGTQTTAQDGTTQINVGWSSLIDPNIKIKPGGIGSGNLHRRGANYKPVDEELIINQRLHKQPIPGSGKKKKKKKKKGGKKSKGGGALPPPPPRSAPPSSKANRPPPARSTFQSRSPPAQSAGAWGSGQLVDKPFWEMQAPAKPEFTPPANNWQGPSSGSMASKYAPKPEATPQPAQQQPTPPPSQQQQQQQQQQWHQPPVQQPRPQQPPQQQQYLAGASSSSLNSKWATESAPTTPPSSTTTTTSTNNMQNPPVSGSAASKYAPANYGSAASKYALQKTISSTDSIHAPKPSMPPASPKERKLLFKFMIELVPGISAPLPVYDTSNYVELVDEFARDHNLHIEDTARHAFASKIAALVEQQLQKKNTSPQQQ